MQPISPNKPIPEDDEPTPTEPPAERSALMKLLARGFLAMLLTACAAPSQAPATYAQGAPMAPRPAPFNPATDAPHTLGQPGHLSTQPYVEPGPKHGRVLPETPATRREPTIWAGDKPKPEGGGAPSMFGVRLPVADDDQDDKAGIAARCAVSMPGFVARAIGADLSAAFAWAKSRDNQERRCVVAKLFQACVAVMSDQYALERSQGTILAPEHKRNIDQAHGVADAFAWAACPHGSLTPEGRKVLDDALAGLARATASARREDGQQ